MNVRLLLFLCFVSLLNSLHSQNLCRNADTTSIPTTFVGTVIPTKLLGTVYFDKSCIPYHTIPFLGLVEVIENMQRFFKEIRDTNLSLFQSSHHFPKYRLRKSRFRVLFMTGTSCSD